MYKWTPNRPTSVFHLASFNPEPCLWSQSWPVKKISRGFPSYFSFCKKKKKKENSAVAGVESDIFKSTSHLWPGWTVQCTEVPKPGARGPIGSLGGGLSNDDLSIIIHQIISTKIAWIKNVIKILSSGKCLSIRLTYHKPETEIRGTKCSFLGHFCNLCRDKAVSQLTAILSILSA